MSIRLPRSQRAGWPVCAGLALLLVACGGPLGPIAGGRLSGVEVAEPVDDWSFASSFDLMEIEVRPSRPYSVKVHYYLVDGRLYFEGGANGWSRWRGYLRDDSRVRVRFGDRVYVARAVAVTDDAEIGSILPRFYAKDRDQPSPACAASWTVAQCGFDGQFYRLDPVGDGTVGG